MFKFDKNFSVLTLSNVITKRGDRYYSAVITINRYILAELNTHRMLCLSGDTVLEFDLPAGSYKGKYKRVHYMTIKEFYDKWYTPISRNNNSRQIKDLSVLTEQRYTTKQLSKLLSYNSASNLNLACREGKLPATKQGCVGRWSWIVETSDFIEYYNRTSAHDYFNTHRLTGMNIRQYNEDTNLITTSTVKDCFKSEPKQLYELVTEHGNKVKASKDHLILTDRGWLPLEQITIEDSVIIKSLGKKNEDMLGSRFQKINGRWKAVFNKQVKPVLLEKQEGCCATCGVKTLLEVHHVVPVYKDVSLAFEESNVILLCESCHNKEHKVQDWERGGTYLYGNYSNVVSITPVGVEETYDLEINGKFPNFLANGIVVHNSKNSASSRAIPAKKMYKSLDEYPFIPSGYQKQHTGMQGVEYIVNLDGDKQYSEANASWLLAKEHAMIISKSMSDKGVTKQVTNRLLEPFLYHTVLISGSKEGWENFFAQRCPVYQLGDNTPKFKSRKDLLEYYGSDDPDFAEELMTKPDMYWASVNRGSAEIHIMQIAELLWNDYYSVVEHYSDGRWILPYDFKLSAQKLYEEFAEEVKDMNVTEKQVFGMEKLIKISTAMAARTSYTTVGDESEITYKRLLEIYEHLVTANPPHRSPFDHPVRVMHPTEYYRYQKRYIIRGPIPEQIRRDIDANVTKVDSILDYFPSEAYEVTEYGWCCHVRGFIPLRHMIENNLPQI